MHPLLRYKGLLSPITFVNHIINVKFTFLSYTTVIKLQL